MIIWVRLIGQGLTSFKIIPLSRIVIMDLECKYRDFLFFADVVMFYFFSWIGIKGRTS